MPMRLLNCLQGRWRGRRFLPGQGLADLHILHLHRTNANPPTETAASEVQRWRWGGEGCRQLNKGTEEEDWLESKGQRERKK